MQSTRNKIDVQIAILNQLSDVSLLKYCQVDKAAANLCRSNKLWQRRIASLFGSEYLPDGSVQNMKQYYFQAKRHFLFDQGLDLSGKNTSLYQFRLALDYDYKLSEHELDSLIYDYPQLYKELDDEMYGQYKLNRAILDNDKNAVDHLLEMGFKPNQDSLDSLIDQIYYSSAFTDFPTIKALTLIDSYGSMFKLLIEYGISQAQYNPFGTHLNDEMREKLNLYGISVPMRYSNKYFKDVDFEDSNLNRMINTYRN